jgi:hypothetical protein
MLVEPSGIHEGAEAAYDGRAMKAQVRRQRIIPRSRGAGLAVHVDHQPGCYGVCHRRQITVSGHGGEPRQAL